MTIIIDLAGGVSFFSSLFLLCESMGIEFISLS